MAGRGATEVSAPAECGRTTEVRREQRVLGRAGSILRSKHRSDDNERVTSDDWPLTGREDLIEQVLHLLADPACDGVHLVGEPGVGTTRILDEVLARLRHQQRNCNRVVASQASRDVAFGALAPVIPGELRPGGAPLDPIELFDRLRFLIGVTRRPTDRFVCAVDDLRWLDDASVGLLAQLLGGGLATVVATVRPDDVMGEALLGLERGWSIRRVTVPRLGHDDTVALVDAALSEAVDGTTARALATASMGNPGHLAELIIGSIDSGALTTVFGMWTLRDRPTVTTRLAALLEQALGGLVDEQRELLELIAMAEPVAVDALAAAGLIDGAVDLEERGLLSASPRRHPSVQLAQPMLGAQLRQRMSPLRRRSIVPRAITLVESHRADDDDLRLALWKLECGLEVPVQQLERAAAVARGRLDFESTERLAGAAARLEPSIGSVLLHAEALHDLCRFDEAEQVLRTADRLVTDDLGRLRVAVLRHRMLLWGELDGEASAAALELAISRLTVPIAIDMALAALANTYVFSGRPALVDGLVAQLTSGADLVHTAMHFPRAIAAALGGCLDDALTLARAGVVRRAELPAEAPVGHRALSDLALGLVLTELGDVHEADAVLARAYSDVVAQHVPQLHTWISLAQGRVALFAGRVGDARRWFVEARSIAEQSRFTTGLRMSLTGLAVCAGHLGDTETARSAHDAACALQPDHGYLWPERQWGAAWAAFAEGDTPRAIAALLVGADEAAARDEVLVEAELLSEAARFGAAARVLPRLRRVAALVDGPLMVARLAFAEGAALGDPKRLAAAEKQFAALDARVAAAECAAELARVLHDDGRVRDAQGAAARSAQHRSGLVAVITPRLVQPATHPRLSTREHEIAALAGSGLASKVIAQRLGLSVRTVSNHLQNVYLKLGVSGRDDLPEALKPGA